MKICCGNTAFLANLLFYGQGTMHNTIIKRNLTQLGVLDRVHILAINGKKPVFRIKKQIGNADFTRLGALEESVESTKLKFTASLPRRAGANGISLFFKKDGEEYVEFPLRLCSFGGEEDNFELEISSEKLPGALCTGLYYYHFAVYFGEVTLCTDSVNNVDFTLSESNDARDFKLLVYDKDYTTPDWFCGNIMYQIFVDRFYKGTRKVPVSQTAVINHDWDNGIPQYGEYPGAFVENNMFFGGTLYGICEKLDYLESLGVGCIYLNPIFKAYSNHKYDTGDYMTVDEMFGGEEALKELLCEAEKRDIRIIFDGVFNHTGDDSLYFNRYGRYESCGAYGNESSPYRDWFIFEQDGKYKAWWGIEILPKLNLANPECENYLLGSGGVLEKYLDMGMAGVRLDVADELPSGFLEKLRTTARNKKEDALIIGEVWENAIDKVSYGERRGYFRGKQLDSVMNYPTKNAIIEYVKSGDAELFYNTVTELYSCYPKQCSDVLMNILGTHDTERILTVLGADDGAGFTNDELSVKRMTKAQRENAVKMLKVASILQYTLFGTPSLYYGDEAGLEGYHDPFCRMPYPWGKEDAELICHYKKLGAIRRGEKVFKKGNFSFVTASCGVCAYKRISGKDEILIASNTGKKDQDFKLTGEYTDLMTGESVKGKISIASMSARILKKIN